VVLELIGVYLLPHWAGLQTRGTVIPPAAMTDDAVDFILPMDRE
jgi:hypothetical protein